MIAANGSSGKKEMIKKYFFLTCFVYELEIAQISHHTHLLSYLFSITATAL